MMTRASIAGTPKSVHGTSARSRCWPTSRPHRAPAADSRTTGDGPFATEMLFFGFPVTPARCVSHERGRGASHESRLLEGKAGPADRSHGLQGELAVALARVVGSGGDRLCPPSA